MKKIIIALGCVMAGAAQAESLVLEGVPPGETLHRSYRCEGDVAALQLPANPVPVVYYNTRGNSLAVLAFADGPRVFANVIAGSGARYVAGALEWWGKGDESRLSSVLPNGPQATCRAVR